MTVDVELTRTTDASDVARVLTAQGFTADAVDGAGRVVVRAGDLAGVEHALEDWAAEQGLPFVAHTLGADRLVLCPPGS
jgi:hypothetical protein